MTDMDELRAIHAQTAEHLDRLVTAGVGEREAVVATVVACAGRAVASGGAALTAAWFRHMADGIESGDWNGAGAGH